ncbi:uncharacterized protein LOC130445587 [Diorhabda sublineata]|uniref:uncharacterized protein LOC130445587 n=1 Tax=Diorhabda sublineata TaxID=1163346 RepID=UPI0024E14331|nr:uncharacterized protein LOC130445587 [Diorhabda sublineata]
MSSLKECLKIANSKFCAFHSCTNNSYRCSDLKFFRFPRACTRVAFNIIESSNKHIKSCLKCKRCQKWSISCKISSDLGFKAHRLYICGKHFIDGHPSNKYPDPMPAEIINRMRKLKKIEHLAMNNGKFSKDLSSLTTDLSFINSKLSSLHDIRDIVSTTTAILDEVYSRVVAEGRRCHVATNALKKLSKKTREKEIFDKLKVLESTITVLDYRLTTSFVITSEDRAVFKETNLSQATRLEEKNKRLIEKKADLIKEIEAKKNILAAEENTLQNLFYSNDSSTIILIVDDDDHK